MVDVITGDKRFFLSLGRLDCFYAYRPLGLRLSI